MDTRTREALCRLNNEFYRSQSAAFSATRVNGWPGWRRCVDSIDDSVVPGDPCRVLDLACGNLRFESYAADCRPQRDWRFSAFDCCDDLLPEWAAHDASIEYRHLDVLENLQRGENAVLAADVPVCDAAVCFGFMHHVPTMAWRQRVLRQLFGCVRAGGVVAVSFWRFMDDPGLAAKAAALQPQALADTGLPELDAGDYLVGWKGVPGCYRYCHSFDDSQIEALAHFVKDEAELLSRYDADGRTGALNAYAIWRVRGTNAAPRC